MNHAARVAEIFRKTLDHHVRDGRPWGWDDGLQGCSYAAGCAIGVSLPKDLAEELDNGQNVNIGELLEHESAVRVALFGPEAEFDADGDAITALTELQSEHDLRAAEAAKHGDSPELHARYARAVQDIASHHEIPLHPIPAARRQP